MIEMCPCSAEGAGTQLRLRPPRALSARQFVMLFAALAGAMWAVAGVGWFAGNVFAPVFALLHSTVVALALRWSWRSGDREEDIRVGPGCVEVTRTNAGTPAFRAHPHWVRLRIEGDDRVVLACSGKQVRVGEFLGPGERRALAQTLEGLLAAATGRNR
ncbi:DUF2244 domain-containing protein [Xanthomonas translucens pv. undulosa]|uniref:DUF2244 domain-containing protein n=1 Tax=Xanthomonas campestris pv. translucens TaxID=343 RepID=UPI0006427F68|nr:DUF2244 domain-containing protein [Xanthomonas translucens]AKK66345.1 membrane protein [Xanthomonas translucens pv. undulosa]MCT8270163.1 DUF2244 domain-containing protein [Xanthomonas translucens pv. undulosa]QSQ41761.1 DUF2244 domain-containing protein [Xanthomonas translucens pv. translucens]QSQ50389.1 DUF2244 domain-containing protein [Xanthomonas translucens pv. undulosa]WLA01397.1 DUF2244 domain-containing protein [Xanthomonas translucens]